MTEGMFYRGYGNCKRCGDRWPILFHIEGGVWHSPLWIPVDGFLTEDEHERMHASLSGRARLYMYKLARKLGFRLAAWPDEVGR